VGRTWSPLIGQTPADLAGLRDKIRLATNTLGERYAYKSLQNQRGLLAAVCERGVEKKFMPVNPTRKLRLPRGVVDPDGEDEHDMRLIEQAEFGILVDAMARGTGRWSGSSAAPASGGARSSCSRSGISASTHLEAAGPGRW